MSAHAAHSSLPAYQAASASPVPLNTPAADRTLPEVEPYEAKPYEVKHYDVAVVGGGIVGLVFACGLRDTGLRVAVIEAQTAKQAAGRQRAYAFSPVSAKILEGLGLWERVGPQLTPFARVKLSDADYRKAITFRPEHGAKHAKREAVYYSAEHTVLMAALQSAVMAADNIDYWCEAQVLAQTDTPSESLPATVLPSMASPRSRPSSSSQSTDGKTTLTVEQNARCYEFRTQLVVGADGARSGVRDRAQIETFGWKYWQSCITAVLEPEQSHENTAYEKFWPSGPFAILPLPHNRCQIVWTAPHAEAKAMLALPKDQFMQELSARYGDQMGQLRLVNQPVMFPVQLMQSKHYVQPGMALIGDAAHCCHPVGGQGLN
ncbi:FAD-dependent oxidoreductase, partial [cf. Phormidesmis sp. LEGE 11477]|uniref:FAD-dependent oxidoreductase n=1 Tax=cf. Phormidesmis sp. LEGE 11477 TaxID=1828680 RepID=UPI001880561D